MNPGSRDPDRSGASPGILGETAHKVVENARADILLARLVSDEPLKRLLLPSAGGEPAKGAADFAASIAVGSGGELTLCTVLPPDASAEDEQAQLTRLEEDSAAARLGGLPTVGTSVLRGRAVVGAILEGNAEHDAIVVGAAGPNFWSFNLFGSVPEQIARDSEVSVLVFKRYRPLEGLVRRVMSDQPRPGSAQARMRGKVVGSAKMAGALRRAESAAAFIVLVVGLLVASRSTVASRGSSPPLTLQPPGQPRSCP